jgi:hypothetical protein
VFWLPFCSNLEPPTPLKLRGELLDAVLPFYSLFQPGGAEEKVRLSASWFNCLASSLAALGRERALARKPS